MSSRQKEHRKGIVYYTVNNGCQFASLLFSCRVESSSSVTPWTVAHHLLCPQDYPGKNIRVGFHVLFQGIFLTQGSNSHHLLHCHVDFFTNEPSGKPCWLENEWQFLSCLTLCDPWTEACQTPYFIHGILQARILEWIAIPFLLDWWWLFSC